MQDYIQRKADINGELASFSVKQYDNNSRKIYISLTDYDNPNESIVNLADHTVRVYFKLPDDSVEYIDGEIEDADNGRISVTLLNSVTQLAGVVQCEVGIFGTEDDSFISLRLFNFVVSPSIRDDDAIEASEKFSALDSAMNTIDVLQARVNELTTLEDGSTTGDAELADIRVGYDGTEYDNAGEAVRGQVSDINDWLDAHALKDYPFEYGTSYTRALDSKTVFSRGAIQYFHVSLKQEVNLPLRMGQFYRYGGGVRVCTICDYNGDTLWQYKESFDSTPDAGVDTFEIDNDYMEGMIIVDWSLVNTANNINLSNDYICFSNLWVDDVSYVKSQVEEIDGRTEDSLRYPFTYDSDLVRSADTSTIWYESRGIKYLRLPVTDNQPYFARNCYANHASLHTAQLDIWSEDWEEKYQVSVEWEADDDGNYTIPDEEIEYQFTDVNSGETVEDSCLIINWSEITPTNATNLEISNSRILEECLVRGESESETSSYMDDYLRYPFTYDSDLVRSADTTTSWYTERSIKYMRLPVTDAQSYYAYACYSNHRSQHFADVYIRSEDKNIGYRVQQYWEADDDGNYSVPDEEMEYQFTDVSTGETVDGSCLIVNWSEMNIANGTGLTIDNSRIREECLVRGDDESASSARNYVEWCAPTDYYVLMNKQQRIYFDEICRTNVFGYFQISSTVTYPQVTYTDRYVEFNTTAAADITVTVALCDYYGNEISSTSITVHSIEESSSYAAKSVMFIGDSLTAAGTMQETFRDMVGDTCTLYGTLGTSPYLHEGRSGWSSADYISSESSGSVTNEFYNPDTGTFDFSYYINNHEDLADVDIVNIFLGRNDGYSSTVRANLETMIESVHEYNADIIITLMGAYNTASDNTGCGQYLQNTYGSSNTSRIYNTSFFSQFEGRENENIFVVPQNLNLDSVYDYDRGTRTVSDRSSETETYYTNNVHPAETGYQHFADVYLAYYNYILSL